METNGKERDLRKERQENLEPWQGSSGFLECPECHSNNILHITIPNEGEVLTCKSCNYKKVIGPEYLPTRRGFTIESGLT